jgi:hypothetical protein
LRQAASGITSAGRRTRERYGARPITKLDGIQQPPPGRDLVEINPIDVDRPANSPGGVHGWTLTETSRARSPVGSSANAERHSASANREPK